MNAIVLLRHATPRTSSHAVRPAGRTRAASLRRWRTAAGLAIGAGLAACGGGQDAPRDTAAAVDAHVALQDDGSSLGTADRRVSAQAVQPRLALLRDDLRAPWALAFLPDGRMLVTERGGRLLRLPSDGRGAATPITGLPAVDARGQGGLLDIAVPPDPQRDPYVYWTYAERGAGRDSARSGTALARGRLVGTRMEDVHVIFRQWPKVLGSEHYGSRIAFRGDGTIFVTLGERRQDDPAHPGLRYAQSLHTELGKVVRLRRDGTVPSDNPWAGRSDVLRTLWSVGHRNPQGAAIQPSTGELWVVEHGPQGGDELNRVGAGRNYGWPLVSYGCPYGAPIGLACAVGGGLHRWPLSPPTSVWSPVSVAPSSVLFYRGGRFPEWNGSVLIGALAGRKIVRIELNGRTELRRESLFAGRGERFRDVVQGPDGWVYTLTDGGRLYRMER